MSRHLCPYCGGTKFYPAEDEGGYVRFMCCEKCHATGPAFDIPQDCFEDDPQDKALNRKALRTFCHPTHLLHGKVILGIGIAQALADEFCHDCLFFPERPLNCGKCKLLRVRRAIEAANGGKS